MARLGVVIALAALVRVQSQSAISLFRLLDLTPTQAYQLDDYLQDRVACFDALNDELRALNVPENYLMFGTQGAKNQIMSAPKLSEVNAVRNATLRVFHIGVALRAPIADCIDHGRCGWVFRHLDALCNRAGGDETDALDRMASDGGKLMSGLMRFVSAWVMPDGHAPMARRRLTTNPPALARAMLHDATSLVARIADAGRRLSLWNHPVGLASTMKTGKLDLKDFLDSIKRRHPEFDADAADAFLQRMERELLGYALDVYADLPMDVKMVAMQALTDPGSRAALIQYLKGTTLLESIAHRFGATDDELRVLRSYASNREPNIDVVVVVLKRRVQISSDAELDAVSVLMRETAPAVRATCALIAWLHEQYPL